MKRRPLEMHHECMKLAFRRRETAVDPLEEPVRRYLVTGDEASLDVVVRETRLRLLSAARRIGDAQDAEDAVQAAYLALVRRRGEPLDAPVFPWLLTAVVRIAYRRKAILRREEAIAKRLALPESPVSPLASVIRGEEGDRLRREVDRLPAGYRDPVVLHYMHGLTTPEVGRLLDLPDATVRTRLRRARLLLRSRFPAGFVYGLLFLPWVVKDAAQGAGLALSGAAIGGVMGTGGVAAIAVMAAALGALAGAKLFGGSEAPAAATSAPTDARAGETEKRRRLELEERLAKTEVALDEANREKAKAAADATVAKKEAEDAKAALSAAQAAAPAAAPAPRVAAGPKFTFGEYDAVLKDVDWSKVGSSMSSMIPLLKDLTERARKGEEPDPESIGKIQQFNGPLVGAALKLGDRIPGTGVNAKFTHPVFAVNSMASALEAAGLPLTETQAETMGRTAQEYADRDRARVAAYAEDAWQLQKIADESDLRDGFFDAAFAILSEPQREALRPEANRGSLGRDLFSSGLLWMQFLRPVQAADKAAAATTLLSQVSGQLGIPEDKKAEFAPLAGEWVEAVPPEWIEKTERFFGQPVLTTAYVKACAKVQLAQMKRIVENPASGEGAMAKARKFGGVIIFVKQQ
jgi:RNA polymerase sigma-70 factor (ECF subfamily)